MSARIWITHIFSVCTINPLASGGMIEILKVLYSKSLYRRVAWALAVKYTLRWMSQNLTDE